MKTVKELCGLQHDPLSYLLSPRQQAWVKYRTLLSVLERDAIDSEVVRWREARDQSPLLRRLRAKQLRDGSFLAMPWRHTHTYEFNQLVLMGFGLEDITVQRAVESLFGEQVAGGGFDAGRRTAKGVEKSKRQDSGSWTPCITAFMARALLDLGMLKDPRVQALLVLLESSQRNSGGWICHRSEHKSSYCVLGGTPWALAVLTRSGAWCGMTGAAQGAIEVIQKHKAKIIRHGYQRDLCYRCDEALLLPSLHRLGLRMKDRLFADLHDSLVDKQTANGCWLFRGRPSAWYTLEATIALQRVREM